MDHHIRRHGTDRREDGSHCGLAHAAADAPVVAVTGGGGGGGGGAGAAGSLASRQAREPGRAPSKQRDSRRRGAGATAAGAAPAGGATACTADARGAAPAAEPAAHGRSRGRGGCRSGRGCGRVQRIDLTHRCRDGVVELLDPGFLTGDRQRRCRVRRGPGTGTLRRRADRPCQARAPSCRWSPRSRPRWEPWPCGGELVPCPPGQSPVPGPPPSLPSPPPSRAGVEVVVVGGTTVVVVVGSPVVAAGSVVVVVSAGAGATAGSRDRNRGTCRRTRGGGGHGRSGGRCRRRHGCRLRRQLGFAELEQGLEMPLLAVQRHLGVVQVPHLGGGGPVDRGVAARRRSCKGESSPPGRRV